MDTTVVIQANPKRVEPEVTFTLPKASDFLTFEFIKQSDGNLLIQSQDARNVFEYDENSTVKWRTFVLNDDGTLSEIQKAK